MLRHIVMWTVDDAADIASFAAELNTCRDLVAGISEFDVGVRSEGCDATHDVVLVSSFDAAAALDAYARHPHHQAVVAKLGAMRESRAVLDFVVD